MGLAEPRKRIKISHDPRNLSWSTSTDSYGQRLMQQQGWKSGEALGANGRGSNYADAEAAKVNVKYKDDTLGLGASLKSKDIAGQRTGFDAFQGLLGRLNAKTDDEVKAVEKKTEDKKLAMFAQGRWGGMVFVPGGLLVQSDPFKQVQALKEAQEKSKTESSRPKSTQTESKSQTFTKSAEDTDKAKRKAEKKQRKEERKLRKEAKRLQQESISNDSETNAGLPTPDPSSSNEKDALAKPAKAEPTQKSNKRDRPPHEASLNPNAKATVVVQQSARNGRHLLRGKNIQAKRMAFSNMKGLDEIFMRTG